MVNSGESITEEKRQKNRERSRFKRYLKGKYNCQNLVHKAVRAASKGLCQELIDLKFYTPNDWKNFPQINFLFCTF